MTQHLYSGAVDTAKLMVQQDGLRSSTLPLEYLQAPKHPLNDDFRSPHESTVGYRHFNAKCALAGAWCPQEPEMPTVMDSCFAVAVAAWGLYSSCWSKYIRWWWMNVWFNCWIFKISYKQRTGFSSKRKYSLCSSIFGVVHGFQGSSIYLFGQKNCYFRAFLCGLYMFSPCAPGFSPGTQASFHKSEKGDGLIGDSTSTIGMSVSARLFVSVWSCDYRWLQVFRVCSTSCPLPAGLLQLLNGMKWI